MGVYKPLSSNNLNVNEIKLNKTFLLTTSSIGLSSVQFRSGSNNLSGSYYDSLRVNYYLSGSELFVDSDSHIYNNPYHSFTYYDTRNSQHKNKFYSSGSIISIGQKLIGEEIKPKSFVLQDKSNSFNKTIIIKDDGRGNLFSTNAEHSQSNLSPSSSDNYVGNIFYNTGVVVLSETGSWSGSVNYTDISTQNYSVKFQSTHTLYIQEYDITVRGSDLNGSNNPTAKSGSTNPSISTDYGQLDSQLTSSGWSPYITTVGLYNDDNDLLVAGRISQPIKKIDWADLTFKLRFDI